MTFRDFVEQALAEFESHLRRGELEPASMKTQMHGARQSALLLLGEPDRKGDAPPRRPQEAGRRFGGPRN